MPYKDNILKYLRQSTNVLIEEYPTSIALKRYSWSRTPSAGIQKNLQMTLPSKNRFFSEERGEPRHIKTEAGEITLVTHVVIGTHDDDIQEGDEFEIGTNRYVIEELDHDRTYQVKGWVRQKT